MKLLLSVLLAGITHWQPAPSAVPAQDYCDLHGVVYVEQVAAFADYRVYVEETESFADLVVYRENAELNADRAGHWHFTDVKSLADFSIYLEEVPGFADFSIAYTDFQAAAGCQ